MKYRKGYKYQLAETESCHIPIYPGVDITTEFINLSRHGQLTIKSGYASDGPSGVTIDTKSSMRGAFVHDALAQLMREGHLSPGLKDMIDDIAYRIWVEDGMCKFRAKIWRGMLEKFDFYVDPKNKKEIYEAP